MVKSQKVSSGLLLGLLSVLAFADAPAASRVPNPRTDAHWIELVLVLAHRVCHTYLLEIEKDRIEAKEHECNCGSEPPEGFVLECIRIEPSTEGYPAFRRMIDMGGVRSAKDEGINANDRGQSCYTADCIVEAQDINEVAKHSRINNACNTGTTGNITYGKTPPLWKPRRRN